MKIIDGLPLPQAILRMAIVTFVENGYEKASMDDVAARASTTKRTVYAHFGNKEELFRRALAMAVQMFQSEMPRLEDTSSPAQQLEGFAVAFAELSTWKGAVRMQRVVMSEAERFDDLALMLHRQIIEHAERMIADYLRAVDGQTQAGTEARSGDWYDQLAKLFLNMTTGEPRFATLLQARQPFPQHPLATTPPDIYRAAIRQAVKIFLQGTGIDQPNQRN